MEGFSASMTGVEIAVGAASRDDRDLMGEMKRKEGIDCAEKRGR